MKTRMFATVLGVSLLVVGAAAQQTSPASGWISLFDGQTLSQWRGFKQTTVPAGWTVKDGTIMWVKGGPDLITREQYANFEFEFEWKLPRGGNSGIIFRLSEEFEATYHSGPEFQILDDAEHPDGKNPLTSAGSNYAIHARSMAMSKPVGEWNTARLVVNGSHVEHWLNGMKVVDYELWTPEWKALVEGSKFKQWPSYGLGKTGHIALQSHGAEVQYRNLRIRRLPRGWMPPEAAGAIGERPRTNTPGPLNGVLVRGRSPIARPGDLRQAQVAPSRAEGR
jgi:hypothetical protein